MDIITSVIFITSSFILPNMHSDFNKKVVEEIKKYCCMG